MHQFPRQWSILITLMWSTRFSLRLKLAVLDFPGLITPSANHFTPSNVLFMYVTWTPGYIIIKEYHVSFYPFRCPVKAGVKWWSNISKPDEVFQNRMNYAKFLLRICSPMRCCARVMGHWVAKGQFKVKFCCLWCKPTSNLVWVGAFCIPS